MLSSFDGNARVLDPDREPVRQRPDQRALESTERGSERGAPLIIFITAYNQHALEALNVGALDYLLKPAREERLRAEAIVSKRLVGAIRDETKW